MALQSGTRLGPYEIQTPLGAGGMGEVYRARDLRLDRTVAIKVLPETLARDPQFRERFDREARAISQLTHPNICTMHDVGEQDGIAFLVLEHLEGETLASRLERTGSIRPAEAIDLAIQIASALDAAHRAGIVHRDLKPANVFLSRRSGAPGSQVAKLLDFGLAKAAPTGIAGSGVSVLPTSPANLTAQGTILGTFQYMAPEQIEGLDADARTDIFAFGCVLHEMLTGRKTFSGRTHASLISSILKDEPAPLALDQPVVPAGLDRLVRTCLAKSPDDRWASAHDVLLQLRAIAQDVASGATSSGPPVVRRRTNLAAIAATSAAMAAIGGAAAWMLKPAAVEPKTPARFSTALPADQVFSRTGRNVIALSPDGTRLVYVANQRLYLRRVGDETATPIRGTDVNPAAPFFSPDGDWIAFFSGGQLANGQIRKVSLSGGPSIVVASVDNPWGASWDEAGMLIAQGAKGILRVPAEGGIPQTLIPPGDGALMMSPQILPGGNAILFTQVSSTATGGLTRFDDAKAVVQRLDTGERRVVFEGGSDFHYATMGYLLFVREGMLTGVPFNPNTLTVTGGPRSLVDGVQLSGITGLAQFAVARNGTLVYVPAGSTEAQQLVWVDRQGRAAPASGAVRGFEDLSLSRDGRRVATTVFGETIGVWVCDLARSVFTRITFNNEGRDPLFTPDGERVVYSALQGARTMLVWRAADGSGQPETLVELGPDAWNGGAASFTPDGQTLLYDRGGDIWMMSLKDRKPVALIKTGFSEFAPALSPDGRWLAYVSNESGRDEIFVQSFPPAGGKWQISTGGGLDPLWAASGQELFYRVEEAIMAVPIAAAPTFAPGTPVKLFEGHYTQTGHDYAISPDGQRFLLIRPAEGLQRAPQIKWVLNWFDELTRSAR